MKKLLLTLILLFITSECFGVAATMYVTPAGAGTKAGGSWGNAMGYAEWEADVEATAEAGDIYYVAGGTYTLTSDWLTALDGTSALPIKIIGVKSTTTNEPPIYSDWAFGDDRPLIAMGTNLFEFDNYWFIFNLRATSSDDGIEIGLGGLIFNCKATNTSATATDRAFDINDVNSKIISCEAIATSCRGFYLYGDGGIFNSYVHDSTEGILCASSNNKIIGTIIDTCTTGISFTQVGQSLYNNTLYNSTTGISGAENGRNVIINNIIDTCTTGASWTTEQKSNFFDYNAWGNNTTDVSNVTKGNNDITSAVPNSYLTASAASGDFTLPTGSACLDAGLQLGANQGVTGDYKINIGIDQDDHETFTFGYGG